MSEKIVMELSGDYGNNYFNMCSALEAFYGDSHEELDKIYYGLNLLFAWEGVQTFTIKFCTWFVAVRLGIADEFIEIEVKY